MRRLIDWLYRGLQALLTFLIAILIVPVTMQIVSRYTALIPNYIWTEEMARFCLIWIIMLGASVAVRDGTHFDVDVLPAFPPRVEAASRLLGGKGKGTANSNSSGTATLAWDCFETIPEVGAFSDWVSNAMSGATLFAGYRGPDGEILPAAEGSRAAELVASIAGGPEGQGVMLGDSGTQLCVTGDLWLIVIPAPESDNMADDRWVVLSTEEVTVQRGKLKAVIDGEEIEMPEYDPKAEQDPTVPVYMRIWKPSPRRHSQATSPVIRSLVVLEELRLLNAAVAAIAKSRITGRGVLLVPAGTRFPTQPGQDGAVDAQRRVDEVPARAEDGARRPASRAARRQRALRLVGTTRGSSIRWHRDRGGV